MLILKRIHNEILEMEIQDYTELVDYFLGDDEAIEFIINHVDHFVAYFDDLMLDDEFDDDSLDAEDF